MIRRKGGREGERKTEVSAGWLSFIPSIIMAAKKHHKSPIVTYLGPSAELPQADLPTVRNMLQQCQLLRERQADAIKTYEVADMASDVLPLILEVWHRANAKFIEIPIRVCDKTLIRRITSKWNTLFKLAYCKKVCPREKRNFTHELDKLFNILTCDCKFVNCVSAK